MQVAKKLKTVMASGQGGTRLFLHIYAQYDNQTGKAKLS
jgi:hypothetical protein